MQSILLRIDSTTKEDTSSSLLDFGNTLVQSGVYPTVYIRILSVKICKI